jgi:hypothetical protein
VLRAFGTSAKKLAGVRISLSAVGNIAFIQKTRSCRKTLKGFQCLSHDKGRADLRATPFNEGFSIDNTVS